MSRRSLKNRYNRKIVAIGDSFGLTFPIEHIDELDWKKGKEVKTKVHDGFWIVCDKNSNFEDLSFNDNNSVQSEDNEALTNQLTEQVMDLKEKLKTAENKVKKANAKIKELETKLNQQQGNLF